MDAVAVCTIAAERVLERITRVSMVAPVVTVLTVACISERAWVARGRRRTRRLGARPSVLHAASHHDFLIVNAGSRNADRFQVGTRVYARVSCGCVHSVATVHVATLCAVFAAGLKEHPLNAQAVAFARRNRHCAVKGAVNVEEVTDAVGTIEGAHKRGSVLIRKPDVHRLFDHSGVRF